MFKKKALVLWLLALLGIGGAIGYNTVVSADRPDCPGKIVCQNTGQEICKDQCPSR